MIHYQRQNINWIITQQVSRHENTVLLMFVYIPDSCWRTLFALVFVSVNMLLNLTVLAIIHERIPRLADPLPDLGFDLLPRWDPALDIAEYLIVALSIGVALLLFVHKYRYEF